MKALEMKRLTQSSFGYWLDVVIRFLYVSPLTLFVAWCFGAMFGLIVGNAFLVSSLFSLFVIVYVGRAVLAQEIGLHRNRWVWVSGVSTVLGFAAIYFASHLLLGRVTITVDSSGATISDVEGLDHLFAAVVGIGVVIACTQALAMKWNVFQAILWMSGMSICACIGTIIAGVFMSFY